MKLHDLTKRTILMLKEKNPEWGCTRISDMLLRGPALPASPANLAGPGIGVHGLRVFFPDKPRSELEHMLARYRQVYLARNKVTLHVLRWMKPGTVWAMDFTKPPKPVDGTYPYIFLVRDLASGKLLTALPVPSRELIHVAGALKALFLEHGAPLVLKSDNEFDPWRIERSDATEMYRAEKLSARGFTMLSQ